MEEIEIVIENFLNDEFSKGIKILDYPKTKFNLYDDGFFLHVLDNELEDYLTE